MNVPRTVIIVHVLVGVLCLYCMFTFRMTQKLVWELAKKKKVEIKHVDKSVLERLSEKRPHQVKATNRISKKW